VRLPNRSLTDRPPATGGTDRDAKRSRVSVTDAKEPAITFTYDDADRLTSNKYPNGSPENHTYETVGNRTAGANHPLWQYDAANQLLNYGVGSHDPDGQTPPDTPSITCKNDQNGYRFIHSSGENAPLLFTAEHSETVPAQMRL